MKLINKDGELTWLSIIFIVVLSTFAIESARAETFLDNVEYQLDAGIVKVEHSWDDKYGYAMFKSDLTAVGVTAWHSSNFGVRFAYGTMDTAQESSGGNYKDVFVKLESITSFEAMYRYKFNDSIYVYGGIGTYLIPTNHWYEGIDPNGHAANDSDDDEGGFIGVNVKVSESIGIEWRFTQYSTIGNEFTRGQSLMLTYIL